MFWISKNSIILDMYSALWIIQAQAVQDIW